MAGVGSKFFALPPAETDHCLPHACLVLMPLAPPQGELDTSARAADEGAGTAALQWVRGEEMQGKGLSSGVKKVRGSARVGRELVDGELRLFGLL